MTGLRREVRVITVAVINQKGGVGKTTTTANLGAGLARLGQRVLLIDLDPQANLTSHLETESFDSLPTTYDLLRGDVPVESMVRASAVQGLSIIPGSGDLAAVELELAAEIGRETILRDRLAVLAGVEPAYDFVLLDCAPSLGLLAINALTAADEVLVPIQAEFFALAGMARFMEVKDLVQNRLNADLRLAGIVICMWKGQANLSREVRDEVRAVFGDILYEIVIRQNVKLAEAPSAARTIFEYAPESNGAADYAALTMEFLRRHDRKLPADALELLLRPKRSEAVEPGQNVGSDDSDPADDPLAVENGVGSNGQTEQELEEISDPADSMKTSGEAEPV